MSRKEHRYAGDDATDRGRELTQSNHQMKS